MIRAIKVSYDTSNLIVTILLARRPPSAMTIKVTVRKALRRYAGIEPGSEMEEPT
jgi:hypothetical protein